MQANTDSLLEFLLPYMKLASKSTSNIQGYLFDSKLYLLNDNTILYIIDLTGKVDCNVVLSVVGTADGIAESNNNLFVYRKACEILLISHTNNTLVYEDPNLSDDPKFINLAMAKTTEGSGWYFMNTAAASIMVPVFNGLPNLQKTDSVGVKVFYMGDNKFIINYTIFKKKMGLSYDLYYQILNVNYPLR